MRSWSESGAGALGDESSVPAEERPRSVRVSRRTNDEEIEGTCGVVVVPITGPGPMTGSCGGGAGVGFRPFE